MKPEIQKTSDHVSPFEKIRRTNEAGVEYWSSRDFAQVLQYNEYRNFEQVIQKARVACFNSGQRLEDHFIDYAVFQNHGYMGLYGGLTAQNIHQRKGLNLNFARKFKNLPMRTAE
jgi:hypothetical protein